MKNVKSLVVLILFFFSLIYFSPVFAEEKLPTPVGKVVWVKGMFKAMMPNKEERILQKDSIIYLKDTLTTDDKSQAQIVYTDKTLITFRAATTFFIEKYEFNPGSKKIVGKYIMNLIQGGFRTITGLIAKQTPDNYRVNTTVATIGVRGTDYVVQLQNGQLLIGYYSGSPCVTGTGGNSKSTLCLTKDEPYAIVPGEGLAPILTKEQPAIFKDILEIIPASMSPFGGSGTTRPRSGPVEGTFSSFCIE